MFNARRVQRIAPIAVVLLLSFGVILPYGCTAQRAGSAGLPAETSRVAFQSQCAQNVIECTTSWPTAVISLTSGPGQTVTRTASGLLVEGSGGGAELVNLVGSGSAAGEGATALTYSWSYGAADADPRTLEPGVEFSTDADPRQLMQPGFHYIRLTVRNDIIRAVVESAEFGVIAENVPSFDFEEVEIEVREAR